MTSQPFTSQFQNQHCCYVLPNSIAFVNLYLKMELYSAFKFVQYILKIYFHLYVWVSVCVQLYHVCAAALRGHRGTWILRAWSCRWLWAALLGYWERNLSPLEEEEGLSTVQPFLCPSKEFILINAFLKPWNLSSFAHDFVGLGYSPRHIATTLLSSI